MPFSGLTNANPGSERRYRLAGAIGAFGNAPFGEPAYRGWQEASKWLERVAPVELPDRPDVLLRKHAPELAHPEAGFTYFARSRHSASSLASIGTPRRGARCTDCRSTEPIFVAQADDLLKRQFDLLTYRTLWFGDPIDWHLDPEEPTRPAGRLEPHRRPRQRERRRQPARVGIESAPVARPARAGVGANRRRRLREGVRQRDRCVARREPARRGHQLGEQRRSRPAAISWCWTLMLLRELAGDTASLAVESARGDLAARDARQTVPVVLLQSRDTDLTGEALGLLLRGDGVPRVPRGRQVARCRHARILVSECDAQMCRDGVHFERSTCYHRYVADDYLHFVLLAERNRIELPDYMSDRVQQMVDFLVAIRRPDGVHSGAWR